MNQADRCNLKILIAKPPEEHNLSTASFVIDLIGQYLKEVAEHLEGMER